MKTLKILGLLLAYPSKEQVSVLAECRTILTQEKWLPENSLKEIDHLIGWMEKQDLLDLQEEYVALFDRTPSLCLHLFEHIHGDSRDRGQALVDLHEVYKDAGLIISSDELPDYLPLFLEYLSVINVDEARDNLGDAINVIATLGGRLKNRQSPYAAIFEALEAAASSQPDKKAVEKALQAANGNVHSLDEIDEIWEEQFAFENSLQTTGQEMEGGCPKVQEMVESMNRPVDTSRVIPAKDGETLS